MTNDEVQSLHKLLDYLKEEEKHFEGCTPKEKREHIFKDILVLRDFEKRVNRYKNRLAERIGELLLQIEGLRNACKLAYSHLKNCEDTDAKSAEVGGKAMKAIEHALYHSSVQHG
jgi:hypothetical protein